MKRTLLIGLGPVGVLLILVALVWHPTRTSRPSDGGAPATVPHLTVENPIAVEPKTTRATPVLPPRPPVPSELTGVFDESRRTVVRMKVVDSLGRDLPPEALSALRWLLRKPDENEALRNCGTRLRE